MSTGEKSVNPTEAELESGPDITQLASACRDVFRAGGAPYHPVEYDPSNESQLASRNLLQGLMWCRSDHATPQNLGPTKPVCSTVWGASEGFNNAPTARQLF